MVSFSLVEFGARNLNPLCFWLSHLLQDVVEAILNIAHTYAKVYPQPVVQKTDVRCVST